MTPMSRLFTACVMSLAVGGEFAANAATLPQLPQKQVDVTMPTVTGSTLNATCATLQTQINTAAALSVSLTHQVILATGTTCTGLYTLPSHTGGTGWILIKGANFTNLPPIGTRVSLSDATLMPKIQHSSSGNVGTIHALTGAQRYRIIGIEFVQNDAQASNNNWITFGYDNEGATNTGYMILDRIVIHDTNASHGSGRAIHADADLGNVALIDSYCAGIKRVGQETQCFQTDKNAGPILVQNSYLEAAGENFMICGGVDPNDAAHMPQDITFRLNDVTIPDAWHFQGGGFVQKALFELKCGVHVLVEANNFSNQAWDGGGFSFRLTPRNVFGDGMFSEMSDITVRYNRVSNVLNWLQIMPNDDQVGTNPALYSKHSKRIWIHDNLVYGLGFGCGGGATCGSMMRITMGGASCTDPNPNCKLNDFTFSHNTVDDIGSVQMCVMQDGVTPRVNVNLDYRDNLINNNAGRGVFDCNVSASYGTNQLNRSWPGPTWSWTNNRIAMNGSGENTANYPQGTNSYPTSAFSFLWTNQAARDYTLQAGSPANNAASDGTDQGVNFSAYNTARAGGSSGGGGDLTPHSIPAKCIY